MVRIIFIFKNSGSCSLIHAPGFANCIACMFQPNALDIGSRGAGVCYVTCDPHVPGVGVKNVVSRQTELYFCGCSSKGGRGTLVFS